MIDKIIFLFRVVRKLEKLESHFVIFQIAVGDTNRGGVSNNIYIIYYYFIIYIIYYIHARSKNDNLTF